MMIDVILAFIGLIDLGMLLFFAALLCVAWEMVRNDAR